MEQEKPTRIERATGVVFAVLVLLVLVSPAVLFVAQEGFGLALPSWLTSEDANYLSGNTEAASLSEHLSLSGFAHEEFQQDVESVVNSHIPFKSYAMLGDAALQRDAIKLSNVLFGWDVIPTKFSSSYVEDSELGMVHVRAYEATEENTLAAGAFADALNALQENNPDLRIVYQDIDDAHSSVVNPSHKYVSRAYPENWFEDAVASQLDPRITVLVDKVSSEDELQNEWFSSEHHWNIDGAIKAYNQIADAMGFESVTVAEEDKLLVKEEWQGATARGGLDLGFPSDFYDIPTDFSSLSVLENGIDKPRGNREAVLAGEAGALPLEAPGLLAEYNMYHWYYGTVVPEVVFTNEEPPNDKTLLFVEQSYGVAVERYLAANYKTTVCIAPANCEVNMTLQEYVDTYGVDDVIVQFGPHPYSFLPNVSPKILEQG